MNDYYDEAIKKLDDGVKAKQGRREAEAMKYAVAAALKDFCRQDAEFSQAVVQGGAFTDCMKAVAGKVKGGSISDIDAFRAAVAFYFPGATIRMQMAIDLCGSVVEDDNGPTKPAERTKVLNLEDFL